MSAPPTGLDAAALRRAAAPLGEAFDLPGEAYTSEDVLAWEQQVMFAGSWVCVGRADAVSEPGSRRSVRIGDDGEIVLRGPTVMRGYRLDPTATTAAWKQVSMGNGHACGDTTAGRT